MRYKLKELGITLPNKRSNVPLTERLLEKYSKDEFAGKSQHQIAREFDVSQQFVCKALNKLGINSNYHNRQRTIEKCEKVLEYIKQNGGYVAHAIRDLDLKVDKGAVYRHATDIGFDLKAYRFAHRTYGHWLTLPGRAKPYQKTDYKLDAVCTLCETVHRVQLINLKSGTSYRVDSLMGSLDSRSSAATAEIFVIAGVHGGVTNGWQRRWRGVVEAGSR